MHVMVNDSKESKQGLYKSPYTTYRYYTSIEYVAPIDLVLHKFSHKLDLGSFGYGPYWACDQNSVAY